MLVSVDNIRVCLHLNPLNCLCCVNLFTSIYNYLFFSQFTANNLKTPCIVFACGTLLGPHEAIELSVQLIMLSNRSDSVGVSGSFLLFLAKPSLVELFLNWFYS